MSTDDITLIVPVFVPEAVWGNLTPEDVDVVRRATARYGQHLLHALSEGRLKPSQLPETPDTAV